MRISACRLCGVPIEQGMRYFTVIEMFMGLVHLKHIVETVVELNFVVMNDAMGMVNDVAYKQNCLNGLLLFIDILRGAFCACLIVQIFSSFFLYFVGYRKRNIPFCLIWILVSANTLIVSLFLLISTLCEIPSKGTESDPMFWKTQLLICGRHPSYGVTIAGYELYSSLEFALSLNLLAAAADLLFIR
ncbi:hypothetical protein Ocin01_01350 [Orchesella cincta]|uniref:Uncharacterized protein n=1 Tax=Orchesella cincta TaxID=48709 RepID=A0A1D2NJ91_ORCCI|nr:hypothetical protein Ocin01_01350 [Orchesella cincta]